MSIELPADCPGVALIAAADARLRQAAFDRLAAAGWLVDAVGDQRAVDRRLAKDVYDLILTDTLDTGAAGPPTRVVRVDPERSDDPTLWSSLLDPA